MEECGAEYFGESGRNGFTRGAEHLLNKEAQDENRSVLKLHANHHHGGADENYDAGRGIWGKNFNSNFVDTIFSMVCFWSLRLPINHI